MTTYPSIVPTTAQVATVNCLQWGDTGKGKILETILAGAYEAGNPFDLVFRATGGNNCGHTLHLPDGRKVVFHGAPSSLVYDDREVISGVGPGCVLDLSDLCENEFPMLEEAQITFNGLRISEDTHLILPWHKELDRKKNQSLAKGGIGSTGRGIGPCYSDRTSRKGIRVRDVLKGRDHLAAKLRELKAYAHLRSETSVDEVLEGLIKHRERIEPHVCDTTLLIHKALSKGRRLLIEGAQGTLLSVDHGTYPNVTSSDPSLNGVASGVGISASDIDYVVGLIKFPFMTRVGGGAFPTEIGGKTAEKYCRDDSNRLKVELERNAIAYTQTNNGITYNPHDEKIIAMMNSEDDMIKAVGLRLAANEFGATTGRPRRGGWTDACAAKYAADMNFGVRRRQAGTIVLMKVDCIAGMDEFNIGYGYSIDGEEISGFPRDHEALSKAKPSLERYEGFSVHENLEGRSRQTLPLGLRRAVVMFGSYSQTDVGYMSIGPKAKDIIEIR